ncbi:MAG: hypothetical protein AAGF12_29810 [Myxococcota bacterium]
MMYGSIGSADAVWQRIMMLLASAMLAISTAGCAVQSDGDSVGSVQSAICCGGNCCLIEGSCFQRGDMNPMNRCETCDPGNSRRDWTAMAGCTPGDADVPDADVPDADVPDADVPDADGPDADVVTPDAAGTPDASTGTPDASTGGGGGDDDGCSVGGSANFGGLAVVLLAFALLRRRRS